MTHQTVRTRIAALEGCALDGARQGRGRGWWWRGDASAAARAGRLGPVEGRRHGPEEARDE